MRREREEIERQQAQKLAEELARKNVKIDVEVRNHYGCKKSLKMTLSLIYVRGISERSAISYAAAETRVHQRLSFTLQRSNAYSISLQSTAATRGS